MDDSKRGMREERFTMLRESLQLLAMPAAAQLAFFPPRWVETAFELADYFIGAYRVIVSNHPKRLRDDQRRRLDLLHEEAGSRGERAGGRIPPYGGCAAWQHGVARPPGVGPRSPPIIRLAPRSAAKGQAQVYRTRRRLPPPLLRTALTVPRCCFALCSVTAALVGRSSSCLRD